MKRMVFLVGIVALGVGVGLFILGLNLGGAVADYENLVATSGRIYIDNAVALWGTIILGSVALVLIASYILRIFPRGRFEALDFYAPSEIDGVVVALLQEDPPDLVAVRRIVRDWRGEEFDERPGEVFRFTSRLSAIAMSPGLGTYPFDAEDADVLEYVFNDFQVERMRGVLVRSLSTLPDGESEDLDNFRIGVLDGFSELRKRQFSIDRLSDSVLKWRWVALFGAVVLTWLIISNAISSFSHGFDFASESAVLGQLLIAALMVFWAFNMFFPTLITERRWMLGFADQCVQFWIQTAYRVLAPFFWIRRLVWRISAK